MANLVVVYCSIRLWNYVNFKIRLASAHPGYPPSY
jgi:hypothetical protein